MSGPWYLHVLRCRSTGEKIEIPRRNHPSTQRDCASLAPTADELTPGKAVRAMVKTVQFPSVHRAYAEARLRRVPLRMPSPARSADASTARRTAGGTELSSDDVPAPSCSTPRVPELCAPRHVYPPSRCMQQEDNATLPIAAKDDPRSVRIGDPPKPDGEPAGAAHRMSIVLYGFPSGS